MPAKVISCAQAGGLSVILWTKLAEPWKNC